MIGNVLDLARGLDREASAPVGLRELLGELAGSDGRVAVTCPDIDLSVPPLALRRAIGNLVDNARRHGGDGPIEVLATVAPSEVHIGVLDRGPGVPEDQREAVFQPFHRIDDARSPAIGGAGLGLAIVRQLADANGWHVALRPRSGGGLEVWLTLPILG